MERPVLVKENPMKKKTKKQQKNNKKKRELLACQWETQFLFKIMEIRFHPLFVSWEYVASLRNKQLRTFVSFG